MQPVRVQRKRVKGWKMPPNTVYVGRPSKWGNIYSTKTDPFIDTLEDAVNAFRWYLTYHIFGKSLRVDAQEELAGKNLACWCRLDMPCHADVLLEIAKGQRAKDMGVSL